MPSYQPQFFFPFAVNSLISIMQFITPFISEKLSYFTRVNVLFGAMTSFMVILPLCTIYPETQEGKFWATFGILLFFPLFNGVI